MDVFNWLLEYGDVLSAPVIVRIVVIGLLFELIGILFSSFKPLIRG